MGCLTPIMIRDKDYQLKIVGNSKAVSILTVPCNKCVNCLRRITDEWITRLSIASFESDCKFVTYTYSDDFLPEDGVCKRDIQLLHKRIRKYLNGSLAKMKYVLISEYGPKTHRPHYHALYFDTPEYMFDLWDKGFVRVYDVIPERLAYVASYHILKNYFVPENKNPNFKLSSNFIGLDNFNFYELENAKNNDWRYLVDSRGIPHVMPRYYRKIYDVKLSPEIPSFIPKLLMDSIDFKNYMSSVKVATDLYVQRKMINKQL